MNTNLASRNTEPAVRVTGLRKVYGDRTVIHDVAFEVGRGEIVGLLGRNGVGKTTTVEIIEGLRDADAGSVEVLGAEWSRGARDIRPRIGIQLQSSAFLPNLTVAESLRTQAALYPAPVNVAELMARFGLVELQKALVSRLSGGEAQRLAVALALAGSPDVLFLDEPTAGLDPAGRRDLWQVVRDVRAAGTSILLTTHFLDEAEALCDSIVVMHDGAVLARGSVTELVASSHLPIRIVLGVDDAFVEAGAYADLTAVTRVVGTAGEVWLETIDFRSTLAELAARDARGALPDRLEIRRPSLEDAFLQLTGYGLSA
jgi:ABC-2 type transport system ATP-binding protein